MCIPKPALITSLFMLEDMRVINKGAIGGMTRMDLLLPCYWADAPFSMA
jgi:hypothetical protein